MTIPQHGVVRGILSNRGCVCRIARGMFREMVRVGIRVTAFAVVR